MIEIEKLFVVVGSGGTWGKGLTLAVAAKNAIKAGGKSSDTVVAYCYVRPGNKPLEPEITVDNYGDIRYPLDAMSIRLFGVNDSKVTIGKLYAK